MLPPPPVYSVDSKNTRYVEPQGETSNCDNLGEFIESKAKDSNNASKDASHSLGVTSELSSERSNLQNLDSKDTSKDASPYFVRLSMTSELRNVTSDSQSVASDLQNLDSKENMQFIESKAKDSNNVSNKDASPYFVRLSMTNGLRSANNDSQGVTSELCNATNDSQGVASDLRSATNDSQCMTNELGSADNNSQGMTSNLQNLDSIETQNYKKNYIGISKSFECRWSFKDNKFIESPSFKHGVAGLFIFANKSVLQNLPESGAFVEWLQTQHIKFDTISLESCKEIGTLLAYTKCNPQSITRPFNKIEFSQDKAIKTPLDTQGREIAKKEIAWYKFVTKHNFANIAQIFSYEPLIMKRIQGKNIFEYECLLDSQKCEILSEIIATLNSLHKIAPKIKANTLDCEETYITKTFNRLEVVRDLVPFAKDEFIKINKRYYKNILFCKDKIERKMRGFYPKNFYVIHGDSTFSNILFDTFNMKCVLIDPRGYFGKTDIYGDRDYDFAKLYYSIIGNYDTFNRKKFSLLIESNSVELAIKSNGWEDMEEIFFEKLRRIDSKLSKIKIKLTHALIWASLTTYAWEDYDSICASFYNANVLLDGLI